MKKKIMAVTITAAMMLTACSTGANTEESSGSVTDNVEIEETEGTTASETTVAETVAETTVTETTPETTVTETAADEEEVSSQDWEYMIFGSYEQDGDESNGPEPIEWIVLSEEEDRVLLLSRYILDYQAYNTELTDVTWETCTLRAWLNDDFYNAAFDASEQEQILTVTNVNDDSLFPYAAGVGGNDTEDNVFLLSSEQAETLFADDDARAVDNCDWWWLRSPGNHNNRAAIVLNIGEMYNYGHLVCFNCFDHGVRPAIWLSIDS